MNIYDKMFVLYAFKSYNCNNNKEYLLIFFLLFLNLFRVVYKNCFNRNYINKVYKVFNDFLGYIKLYYLFAQIYLDFMTFNYFLYSFKEKTDFKL